MRILGIDYGEKRIGVAVSDPLSLTAQGEAVIVRSRSVTADIGEIKKIMQKFGNVEEIIVGLPLTMRGGHQGRRRSRS